jgi:ABC-type phosphate/phosphonate transport system substrate-binding protein
MPRTQSARSLIVSLLFIPWAAYAQPRPVVQFIGVSAGDSALEHNDTTLCNFLTGHAQIKCDREDGQPATYSAGIDAVRTLSAKGDRFVARLTPYALVAAELEGARFDVLGAYTRVSPLEKDPVPTYRAYFVVRRSAFTQEPDERAITAYLKASKRKFAYHDRFSTSSYFVPLLFFKAHDILDTDNGQKTGEIDPVEVLTPSKGQSARDSVLLVEKGRADLAAVWDGTRAKIDKEQENPEGPDKVHNDKLWFVPIDRALPNDLIVASRGMPEYEQLHAAVAKLSSACGADPSMFQGDVRCWLDFGAPVTGGSARDAEMARNALNALNALRQDAAPEAPRMTVRINALCRNM